MTVEALILVKTMPGKTRKVVERIARSKDKLSKEYKEKAIKQVYLATGEYDIIVHVSAEDPSEIFYLADRIREIEASPQTAVSSIEIVYLWPKSAGDP